MIHDFQIEHDKTPLRGRLSSVLLDGIEPSLRIPQTRVLSIERQKPNEAIPYGYVLTFPYAPSEAHVLPRVPEQWGTGVNENLLERF